MAKPDDGLVVAEPGDVNGHNEGRAGVAVFLAINGRLYHVGGKEAVERLRRELTFDTYLGLVAVLAVFAQNVCERVLVRKADFAAVNVPRTVHVGVLVETVGELAVRGDNVMKGYWKKPEETKKVLDEDGWLRTGDLVYMDADGYIYIVDRIKDLIIMNGENIYPGEVEDCIYEVEGVGECAVVGHPDPLRGQSVWAYVVMKEGFAFDEDKIRKHMVKNIASYKIPRRFIPLDALPKNATGKILKRALRDS